MSEKTLKVKGPFRIQGDVEVPGDKSISHRAVLLLALSNGTAKINGFLHSADCIATINAMRSLGVEVDLSNPAQVTIKGVGLFGLTEPEDIIDCGNSGTLMRLILGILAGQNLTVFLTGDDSLRLRPIDRVIDPLRSMGATILARAENTRAPVAIRGGDLAPIAYTLPVASAQVKSCVLLAGLFARGVTEVHESRPTRDHTERMLEYLGARVRRVPGGVAVEGRSPLEARDIEVPGDISSAAFVICSAAASPNSSLTVKRVGVNPTRIGLLRVLERMGADIEIRSRRVVNNEPVADVAVVGRQLRGVTILPEEIPDIIDEIPILSLIATQCYGTTSILGAGELRVKESDRLQAIKDMLERLGASVSVEGQDIRISGPAKLRPCTIDSRGDHRIAMTAAMAGAFVDGVVEVRGADCVDISFPGFDRFLAELSSDNAGKVTL